MRSPINAAGHSFVVAKTTRKSFNVLRISIVTWYLFLLLKVLRSTRPARAGKKPQTAARG